MAEVTALRNNALPYPIYGIPYGVAFPLLDADGDPISPSSPDSEVSLNGDTFADCTNEAVEIATGSGVCYLLLTAAEVTADVVTVRIQSTGAKTTVLVLYPRKLVALRTGTATGGAAGSITLDAAAGATNDIWNGCVCVAVIDTLVEARVISDYVGSSKVASVVPNWNVTPDTDDTFTILMPEGMAGIKALLGTPTDTDLATDIANVQAVIDASPTLLQFMTAMFTTDSTSNYGVSIAGSVVKEIADNASGGVGGVTDWTANERAAIRTILGVPAAGTTPEAPTDGVLDDLSDRLGVPSDLGSGLTLANNTADISARVGTPTNMGSGVTIADNLTDINTQAVQIGTTSLVSTTIATLTSQTVFTLTDGSATADTYNDCLVIIRSNITTDVAVGVVLDYSATTKQITLVVDPAIFVMAVGNFVEIMPAVSLSQSAVVKIFTTVITEAYRSTGATGTAAQLLYEILGNLIEQNYVGTTKTVKKLDGTTAKTYTVNSSTAPTTITETT